LYAPIPMATVGSPEVAQAVCEALAPLPEDRLDAQFDLGVELLSAADRAGFELCLFAERHLGNDIGAWVLASAIGSRPHHNPPPGGGDPGPGGSGGVGGGA